MSQKGRAMVAANVVTWYCHDRPRLRDMRRRRLGLCRTCGYDLSATKDRRAECGSDPAVART